MVGKVGKVSNSQEFCHGLTHADMVIQVVANWEIDPLVGRNHSRAIGRVFDNVELVGRANATWAVSAIEINRDK